MSGLLLEFEEEEADHSPASSDVTAVDSGFSEIDFAGIVNASTPYSIDQLNLQSPSIESEPDITTDVISVILSILEKGVNLSFFRLVQKNDKMKPTTDKEAIGAQREGVVVERCHVGDSSQFNGAVIGSIYYLVDDGSSLYVVVSTEQLRSLNDPDIGFVCKQVASEYIGIKAMQYRGKQCFSKQFVYDKLWKKLKRSGRTF